MPNEDFVSRQWLIEEYHRRHQGPPGGALKMIEEAPAADVEPKQRWVSVTESLPEDDTIVLVVSLLYHKPYPAFQIGGVWYDSFLVACQAAIGMKDEETIDNSGITHWMPLPEPPKGEENATDILSVTAAESNLDR